MTVVGLYGPPTMNFPLTPSTPPLCAALFIPNSRKDNIEIIILIRTTIIKIIITINQM